ncbi:MAG TPA: CheR family methyltransferase [Methylovirgula sp.]
MAHPIDTTLAILHDVMTAHRQALTREPENTALAAVSLPRSERADLVLRLLAGVEKRVGIEVAQAPAEKLLRGLSTVDTKALEAWVSELEILPTSDRQWISLIESLTVHETYVMRDPAQLEHFAAQLPGLIAQSDAQLRLWSVGCATGEEAYSVAALAFDAMLEAGHAVATEPAMSLLPPWRMEVLGSDVSRSVLARARTGLYETGPLSSFRAQSALVLRHFPPARDKGKARVAAPHLKDVVSFAPFNLIEDATPQPPFDAVFCRNVLIYFSPRARRIAFDKLTRAVRPGGYLVLGPTDTLGEAHDFDAVWSEDAVIYRRRNA